jgi:predicted nucleotide-binding protein
MADADSSAVKAKVTRRNFPSDSLEEALALPRAILDDRAGQPYNRLLLADSIGIKPGSTNYRDLLSSSLKYGLTEGTEKAAEISLTELGRMAAQSADPAKRRAAIRQAAFKPEVFGEFYTQYRNSKLPAPDTLAKILTSNFKVPSSYATECATLIAENGRFAGIIRDVSGSPHVLWDADLETEVHDAVSTFPGDISEDGTSDNEAQNGFQPEFSPRLIAPVSDVATVQQSPRAIFVGHGKKKEPLEKLEKILRSFDIPFKVVIDEANRGRPIPQKVKDTMQECGSAILIFTKDEKFLDEQGNEVWRPSENVVHELGAASYAYEDRVVIFKEEGIHFPANYSSVGYIEFEEDNIEAKTMELFKELREFGLIRITTA